LLTQFVSQFPSAFKLPGFYYIRECEIKQSQIAHHWANLSHGQNLEPRKYPRGREEMGDGHVENDSM